MPGPVLSFPTGSYNSGPIFRFPVFGRIGRSKHLAKVGNAHVAGTVYAGATCTVAGLKVPFHRLAIADLAPSDLQKDIVVVPVCIEFKPLSAAIGVAWASTLEVIVTNTERTASVAAPFFLEGANMVGTAFVKAGVAIAVPDLKVDNSNSREREKYKRGELHFGGFVEESTKMLCVQGGFLFVKGL